MGWRNPFFQKKRGGRSTGMRNLAYWSELLLSVSLVVVGGATLLLHIFQVLVPDWRASRAPAGFEAGICEITEQREPRRDGPLGVIGSGLELQASRVTDDGKLLPPVWIKREVGSFSPTRTDVEDMAAIYAVGTDHACWFDPNNSSRLMLRRPLRWWPWPVALIPLSLFAVGVWGIIASLMQVVTSVERRSLVAGNARRLDPMRESSAESATLAEFSAADEEHGVRYPHRLPAIGTAGWRMAGLMLVTTIWNILLAYFVYVASLQMLRGDPAWLVLVLVVMLGLVGLWLAFNLIREFWERRGIGQTHLEISEHPLALGGQYAVFLSQTGRMKLRRLTAELVCEEAASYQQGTDLRTSVAVVHREELGKWIGIRVEMGQPFEMDFTFTVPAEAMHSFRSPHNEVRWMLVVEGETDRGQEVHRQYSMNVRPAIKPGDGQQVAFVEPSEMEPTA